MRNSHANLGLSACEKPNLAVVDIRSSYEVTYITVGGSH